MVASVYDIQGFAAHLEALLDTTDPEEWETRLGAELDAFDGDVEALLTHLGTLRERYGEFARLNRDLARNHTESARRWEQRLGAVVDQARQVLEANERLTGEPRVRTAFGTVYLHPSKRLEHPANVDEWPDDLVTVETVRKPNRKAAAAAVEAGTAPEGFALVDARVAAWRTK